MNLAGWVEKWGRAAPDQVAIALGSDACATYRQWAARSRAMAGNLAASCLPQARVAIAMTNRPEFLEALFAIWHAGLVAVPMNAKLHRDEFGYIVGDTEAALILASPDRADDVAPHGRTIVTGSGEWRKLAEADGIDVVPRRRDDLAWLFYTSGTTGRPKGAMLTHGNMMEQTLAYFAEIEPVGAGDAVMHAAPMSHGSGCYGLPFVAMGAKTVIPESAGFDPEEVAQILSAHRNVSFFAAPTMVNRLITHGGFAAADHRGLRTIIYGGAPMHFETLQGAMNLLGPKLAQIYGQGEVPMTITALSKELHADRTRPRWREIMGSVGLPRANVEVRVADEADRALPTGKIGEILVRGEVVMKGYWNNPSATAETLRSGWLHTGDMGAFDGEGFLTLKDRSKDMIISGGSNIYPREVEEILLRHPSVLEVSVIGRPHPDWGEEVVACVVAQAEQKVSADELEAFCLSAIARFKRPRHYVFLEALPKNNYGKVLKTELRRRDTGNVGTERPSDKSSASS
ncbi:MAG: AMP-binding protein [Xanthobacteraceae bacterium]